jgi:hypothetical protein
MNDFTFSRRSVPLTWLAGKTCVFDADTPVLKNQLGKGYVL